MKGELRSGGEESKVKGEGKEVGVTGGKCMGAVGRTGEGWVAELTHSAQ